MVEKINTQDMYIQKYIEKMPKVEKGEAHVVKRGDSLWNIARSKCGKKPKRSEINNYMLAIAKLNGLNTAQKMNNIKVNSTIYLPKDVLIADKSNIYPTKSLSQDKNINKNPKSYPKTPAEKYFDNKLNKVLTDKSVYIKKAELMYDSENSLYHISYNYKDNKGFMLFDRSLMSVTVKNKNGEIENIAFEGEKNIYDYGYDYKIEKNNVIKSNAPLNNTVYGKITPEQRIQLEKFMQKQINKSK